VKVELFCKNERAGILVIGTCLAKFDCDLDLDESLQFLSSLCLNTLNFRSLPSLALLMFLSVVLVL